MKRILPLLFLIAYFLFVDPSFASVDFQISNPTLIGDYYTVDASLSGISSTSAFIQAMFTHTSSTDYFGFTWGQQEEWVPYQTPNKEFITSKLPIILRDKLQKIWIRPDFSDRGYKGPGEYFLRLRRFTGQSDSPAGDPSNSLTVSLSAPVPVSSPSITESPSLTPTPSVLVSIPPTHTPTPTSLPPTRTPTPTAIKTAAPTVVIKGAPKYDLNGTVSGLVSQITPEQSSVWGADLVLGESTTSSTLGSSVGSDVVTKDAEVSRQINLKHTFVIGVLIASISGAVLYFRLHSQ